MECDFEKLEYLFNNMDCIIVELIDKVLSDSSTNSHYSAVAATNKMLY